eukprot:gene39137-52889_t
MSNLLCCFFISALLALSLLTARFHGIRTHRGIIRKDIVGTASRTWRLSKTWKIHSTNANIGGTDTDTAVGALTAPPSPQLTQKEYLIAIRNRLFTVEEQIWLHEYAVARGSTKSAVPPPSSSSSPPPAASASAAKKIEPLSEAKYAALLRARGELLEEYPLTKLHTDLYDAQKNNLTYA